MTNQAAQTMPELPEPDVKVFNELAPLGHVITGYTADQMHQYARDYAAMLAAAPAASGGEDDAGCTCGACPLPAGCKIGDCMRGLNNTPEDSSPPSAASVSERARAIEILAGVCLVQPSSITENTDSDVSVELALRAIEQALTQQRWECVDAAGVLRWAASILYMWEGDPNETGYMGDFRDAEQILHLLADHATPTPQPSADAVLELAAKWRKRAERKRFVGLKNEALLDEAHADELESLLSGGSHA